PLERLLKADRLGGDDQHVDGLVQLGDRARSRDEVPEADALERDSPCLDHLRGLLARDDHHLVAVLVERRGEQAADASRAEHGDPHAPAFSSTPGFITPDGSTAAFAPRSAAANGSGRWRSYHG